MNDVLAYNIPLASILLMLITAIITPILPDKNRLPEKLSCWVIGVIMILSGYLIYALTNS